MMTVRLDGDRGIVAVLDKFSAASSSFIENLQFYFASKDNRGDLLEAVAEHRAKRDCHCDATGQDEHNVVDE